jgi:hypothetical protein
MTPAEAGAYLDRCRDLDESATVAYRPSCGHTEEGVITRVSGTWVFVRYGSQPGAIATDPADLELLAGKVPGDD